MLRRDVEDRTILLALTGSHLYGMATETSDKDYKGIFIAPKEYYLGTQNVEQKDSGWNEEGNGHFSQLDNNRDTVIYELRKYIKLASQCNPNILELLFADQFIEYLHPVYGIKLIDKRKLFLSNRVRHTYAGYAHAQIKKVRTHRKWLLNPPTHRPTPEEFGLEKVGGPFAWLLIRDRVEYIEEEKELYTLLKERIDLKGALKDTKRGIPDYCLEDIQSLTNASDEFMAKVTKTQQFRKALNYWDSYNSWKKNRNADRASLEAKCGYDSKHMAHCIRLLRTGNEILLTGRLIPNRSNIDAEELLNIRLGNVSYDVVEDMADKLFADLSINTEKSKLPYSIDNKAVDNLLIEIVESCI